MRHRLTAAILGCALVAGCQGVGGTPASAARLTCAGGEAVDLSDAVRDGRYYSRRGSFDLARLAERCGWARDAAAADAVMVAARQGAVDPVAEPLIAHAVGRLTDTAYLDAARTHIGQLAPSGAPLGIELASVLVDYGAGYCRNTADTACFRRFAAAAAPAARLDPLASWVFGDLLGQPLGARPDGPLTTQAEAEFGRRLDGPGADADARRRFFQSRYGLEFKR